MSIRISSADLEVTVNPLVGGTITSVIHRKTGASILGTVPWDPVDAPITNFAARDEPEWLTRFTGGWPLLFPNGGEACMVDGVFHGFHGEASISPWRARATVENIQMSRSFNSVSVEMIRDISVRDDLLIIEESLHMHGPSAIDVMWGHHATFGSILLEGDVEITSSAQNVMADASYDHPANPLQPGATGTWPMLAGKSTLVDMSLPRVVTASLAYLYNFRQAWAAIRRIDNSIAATLSWDAALFPCAWLWQELGGTHDAPWNGRTRLIGIEPSSTMPALGIEKSKAAGGQLMRLDPGSTHATSLRLHVCKPSGSIRSINSAGRCVA